MKGDSLELASEKILLEIPTQREQCCHTGGSMAFDAHGNLFLSTGDNTNPHATGYAPIDERAGSRAVGRAEVVGQHERPARQDPAHPPRAERHVHDPRGQPLREGNAEDAARRSTRWGTAIPIASRWTSTPASSTGATSAPTRRRIRRSAVRRDTTRSIRRASAGNFGWPYFVGDNKAYFDYDFATNTPGKQFDPAHPVNDSPNNTGLTELPPAQKAFIWYPAGQVGGVPARRHRRSHGDGGPGVPSRRLQERGARLPGVLRRQAPHVRVDARLDHGGHDERERRPRVHGAVHAEPEVQQPDRAGVLAERRSVHARVRDRLVPGQSATRGSCASSTTAATGSRSSSRAVDKEAGPTPLDGRAVVAGDERPRRRRAALSVDDHAGRRAPWCAR